MGILSWFKIAGVALIVIALGYLIWNYKHMESVIEAQKQEIAVLKQSVEVIEKAQAATKKYVDDKTRIQRRSASEQAQIDSVVESGDDAGLRALYERFGMLPQGNRNDPQDRPKRNP